jgi:hypothetical protein
MAIKGKVGTRQVSRDQGDGQFKEFHVNKAGDLYTANFIDGLIVEGKAYSVRWGGGIANLITPAVGGGAATVADLDRPEILISVPSGTGIFPIRFNVAATIAAAAANHDLYNVLLAADLTASWAVDGTYTAATPRGLRTDIVAGSKCTAAVAFTADTTDPVLTIDLFRQSFIVNLDAAGQTIFGINATYEPLRPRFIVGPAMVVAYIGGTAATSGYATLEWAECNVSDYGSL